MKKMWWIGIIAALLFFLLADFAAGGRILGDFSPKYQFQRIQFKIRVKNASRKYHHRNLELLKEFEQELTTAGKEDFELARLRVNYTADCLSGYMWCAKLCCKLVKDKIKKTHDTEKAVLDVLCPNIIVPCEQGYAKMIDRMKNFQHKLMENDNQYRAELAQIAEEKDYFNGKTAAREQFLDSNMQILSQVQNLAMSKVFTTVGAAVELICIRQTVGILVKVCSHIAGRLATGGAAAATAAVADGPLPIGDIIGAGIAVVSVAWCAYDVYQVQVVLPREMRKTIHEAINNYERDARNQLLDTARQFVQDYKNSSDKIIEQL